MKGTIEFPDALFRRAKSAPVERGIPFRELVSEALTEKLTLGAIEDKPWMRAFGKLRGLREESARIERIIEEEFDRVEARPGPQAV